MSTEQLQPIHHILERWIRYKDGPTILKANLLGADWVLATDPIETRFLKPGDRLDNFLDDLQSLPSLSGIPEEFQPFFGFTGIVTYEDLANNLGFSLPQEGISTRMYRMGTVLVQYGDCVSSYCVRSGRAADINVNPGILDLRMPYFPEFEFLGVQPDYPDYAEAFSRARAAVIQGHTYQVKLSLKFSLRGRVQADELFWKICSINPSPEAMLLIDGKEAVISCSPETLLTIRDGQALTRPIGGTWRKAENIDASGLTLSRKELCEHNMLVDLERNDLSGFCEPGSVKVTRFREIEEYSHLYHLVTEIAGRVKPDTKLSRIASSFFPGGTITGCPKLSSMAYIHALERFPRGPYTGNFIHFSQNRDLHSSILIRTMVCQGKMVTVQAGGGIVHDSNPEYEYRENFAKAQALLQALDVQVSPEVSPVMVCPEISTPVGFILKEQAKTADSWNRDDILLLNHQDSFSLNVYHWLMQAKNCVMVEAGTLSLIRLLRNPPALLVLSPGPGHPRDWPQTLELINGLIALGIPVPILGICLGFQCLMHALGQKVEPLSNPCHGHEEHVQFEKCRLFANAPDFVVGRYHSLGVFRPNLPAGYRVIATASDGSIQGLEHQVWPVIGLQFHPESFLTQDSQLIRERVISTLIPD